MPSQTRPPRSGIVTAAVLNVPRRASTAQLFATVALAARDLVMSAGAKPASIGLA